MSSSEKALLTPEKLKLLGHAKEIHLLDILETRGKLRGLEEPELRLLQSLRKENPNKAIQGLQEKARGLLVALFNKTVAPFQRDFIADVTPLEMKELSVKEKIDLLDVVLSDENIKKSPDFDKLQEDKKRLQEGEREHNTDLIIEMFNKLSLTKKTDFRQMLKTSRETFEEVKKELETAVQDELRLKRRLNRSRQKAENAREIQDLDREIAECTKNLAEYKRRQEVLQKSLTESQPIAMRAEEMEATELKSEIGDIATSLFSEETIDGPEEVMIEQVARVQLAPFKEASGEVVKSYYSYCQEKVADRHGFEQKTLQKQMDIIKELRPEVVEEPKRVEILSPAPESALEAKKPELPTAPPKRNAVVRFFSTVVSPFRKFFSWVGSLFRR